MSKKGKKALQDIVDGAVLSYKNEQAMNFCECSIGLMLTTMSVANVTNFLRAQIAILEEYE